MENLIKEAEEILDDKLKKIMDELVIDIQAEQGFYYIPFF